MNQLFENYVYEMNHSTVVITGAAGMIGSCIVNSVVEVIEKHHLDITIYAIEYSSDRIDATLQDSLKKSYVHLVETDITKSVKIEGRVDYIIHTAGVTGGSKQHIEYPVKTIDVALFGTKNILELAKEKQSKGMVFLSSLEIYGNAESENGNIDESNFGSVDVTCVRSSYSESKRMCENMCCAYAAQFGLRICSVRLTATFGSGINYRDNRVFAQFARSIIEKKDIILKSNGSTERNYCDVEDAACAILCVLLHGKTGNSYNVANMDTAVSIKELAEHFIHLYVESGIQLKFDIVLDIEKLGYNKAICVKLNSEKLMKLGWKPYYSLDDMIQHLVSYMEQHRY